MAKRQHSKRRRQLRGTTEEHHRVAGAVLRSLTREIPIVRRTIKVGNCGLAYRDLLRVGKMSDFVRANVTMAGSSSAEFARRHEALEGYHEEIEELEDAFEVACVLQ